MKKYKMKKIIFLFLISFCLINIAYGADYTVLAPLPFATDSSGKANLSTYIPGLFKLLIGSGAVLAFLFIVWYGFEYMFSDSLISKSKARERIGEVIGGLLLIIFAYAILYNINPRMLNMQLTLNRPVVTDTGVRLSDISMTGGCSNCQTLNSFGVNVKAGQGTNVTPELGSKLKTLNGSTSGLLVTEGYPPTRTHVDPCHQNGSCVDAVISGMNDANNVKSFILKSKETGLRAVFETSDADVADKLSKAGLTPKVDFLLLPKGDCSGCITGSHFSIYNK